MLSVFRQARTANLAAIFLFTCALDTAAQTSGQWFLMARHGECAEISSLLRKIPDLGAPESPNEFVEIMKNRGLGVDQTPLSLPHGEAVELNVTELSLNLIFVTSDLCSELIEHP